MLESQPKGIGTASLDADTWYEGVIRNGAEAPFSSLNDLCPESH